MNVVEKWNKMKSGEWVVTNDAELAEIEKMVIGTPDEDLFYERSVSILNPERCGLRDKYKATVKGG